MFSYRQGNFVLKLSEPSLFLLIHGQNNHPARSVKIVLQSEKSQGKVREKSGIFFVPVGGNLVLIVQR